jgi:hypothetical protein
LPIRIKVGVADPLPRASDIVPGVFADEKASV